MCGISGIVALNSKRFETNIDKMNKSLSNRGPDTNGKLIYGDCILGHTRLSIIDLINGHQPMDNDPHDRFLFARPEDLGSLYRIYESLN